MFAVAAVHTTGVNWDGVVANVAAITVTISIIAAVITRSVKRSVREQISVVITRDVTPRLDAIATELRNHDNRIARLEGMEEGKRQAIAAAGVTTT